MPQKTSQPLRHIIIDSPAKQEEFSGRGQAPPFQLNQRERSEHGQMLIEQLRLIESEAQKISNSIETEHVVERGTYVQFESDAGYELKLESLEGRRQGVKLLAVSSLPVEDGELKKQVATVFVPEGKIEFFLKKIETYLTQDTSSGVARNKPLVESISAIRQATLKSLWTDEPSLFPEPDELMWWELWLRTGGTESERRNIIEKFLAHSIEKQLLVKEEIVYFPETSVMILKGSATQIAQSVFLLNALSEVRRAKESAEFFTGLEYKDQKDWADDAASRLVLPEKDAPVVCLLDIGVNNAHPLLKASLPDSDMHTYKPAWGKADNKTHGTAMAGLGLYGDLYSDLISQDSITLTHQLESVKILPPSGQDPNEPENYGAITSAGIALAEFAAPYRNRTICLTVTTTDFRDRGQPSLWSATIDKLCSGADEEDKKRRLILVAAGNTNEMSAINYPDSNITDGIHDPGQAWNAITIGAYTEKDAINSEEFPSFRPIAPTGKLSPSSTTSRIWESQWPLKPDVVLEGGNWAIHPEQGISYPDSLQLLTTNAHWKINKLFTTTRDTSAATAQAARICAQIYASYPDLWPETIRGLLIHSADWTEEMFPKQLRFSLPKREVETILRQYGYGVPDLNRALYSASNVLTLIAQDSIQPFVKVGSEVKMNMMNLHQLPWPQDVLLSLGETVVEMRVTLSYFIEPKPERNQVRRQQRYRSHGLRFDLKRPTETVDEFRRRVNLAARDEDDYLTTSPDSFNWLIGTQKRHHGSLHCDIWRGRAAELAKKGVVAIYPVGGWWKDRPYLEKTNEVARYSLIVTISTPEVTTDIYSPVLNLISVDAT